MDPKGKKVLLLGAGGAARAIAYRCRREAEELCNFESVTSKPAAELANLLKQKFNKKVFAYAAFAINN